MPTLVKRILVPLDHSEASLQAAALGLTIARSLSASLTLLHVQAGAGLELFHLDYTAFDGMSEEEAHDLILRYVQDPYLDSVQSAIDGGDIDVQFEGCNCSPSAAICEYASAQDVDLIVMGSRGRSGVKKLLVGSVSSHVLHHAPCPVTIVR